MFYFQGQIEVIQQLILTALAIITALIAIYALNVWILTFTSIRGRNKLPDPPAISNWPMVSIHLPFFNEKRVAARLLESCVRLDYPRDKLEIIVVDDSTDETTTTARSFESRYPNLVRVIHRNERQGYKAGALRVALNNSNGEFIALFDADYVPPRDFLRRMIPYLYVDERVAFAQARWSYLDGGFSWMARAISLAIDVYAFIDQRARYVANLLAHFSGTCGVFRRKAIEDAGGWQADTLAEDLDLSIRLHLKGWRYVYVPSVVCPGEIPASFDTLKRQQFRWARGFSECLRKHWLAIVRSNKLSLFQKVEATLHLGTYFMSPLTIIGLVVALVYYTIFPPSFWLLGFWKVKAALLTFALSLVIYTAPIVASGVTLSEHGEGGGFNFRRLLHLGYLGAVVYALLLSNTIGLIQGLLGTASYFHRTPKYGSLRAAKEIR